MTHFLDFRTVGPFRLATGFKKIAFSLIHDLLQSTSQAEAGFEEAYLVRTQVFALVFQWLERGHATLRALKSRVADNTTFFSSYYLQYFFCFFFLSH